MSDGAELPGSPDGVPRIDDWNRLLDGRVAVITGGGWLFSPREGRFVNRSRHL